MKLNDGEIICPVCKANYIVGKGRPLIWGCEKCKGSGKLDWIEVIVGKKKEQLGINLRHGSSLGLQKNHPSVHFSIRGDTYENIKEQIMYVFTGVFWKKMSETRCYYT